MNSTPKTIDAKTLLALQRSATAPPSQTLTITPDLLGTLVEAYIERAALIVVNDQMEKQGAEIAPYWAHHMMARVLAKGACDLITSKNPDNCRGSSLCITEYCPHCYAKVWWESQHKHKAMRFRDGMPKGAKEC